MQLDLVSNSVRALRPKFDLGMAKKKTDSFYDRYSISIWQSGLSCALFPKTSKIDSYKTCQSWNDKVKIMHCMYKRGCILSFQFTNISFRTYEFTNKGQKSKSPNSPKRLSQNSNIRKCVLEISANWKDNTHPLYSRKIILLVFFFYRTMLLNYRVFWISTVES